MGRNSVGMTHRSCPACVGDKGIREDEHSGLRLAAYQRPWMVHEFEGPVTGLVSQNCVCSNRPPGDSKQQVPELDELQLVGEPIGHDCN